MEKKLLAVLIAFQAALFGHEVVVTEKDNGTTIELGIKDSVRVDLPGNPTTGFTWEEQSSAETILHKKKQTYSSSSTLVGAGGLYTFTYEATSVGSTQLSFIYFRPWEVDVPPAKRFAITVITHPAEES